MHRLLRTARGLLTLFAFVLNTIFWVCPLMLLALIKLLLPLPRWRKGCDPLLTGIAECWIAVNNLMLRGLTTISCEIPEIDTLDRKAWYLVIANHQSWVDILVLQHIFYRRIPFLKFFLKKELIWVPFLGLAWWALDFPFMKRYSKSFLKRKPHLAGRDIDITRQACKKFRNIPVSVMNFIEGTRFSTSKQGRQRSPYRYLLKPKSGGVAMVLTTMGDRIEHMLDVTIAYPGKKNSFWNLVCGRLSEVRVRVDVVPIAEDLRVAYFESAQNRTRFQQGMNRIWQQKDVRIAAMLSDVETVREPVESSGSRPLHKTTCPQTPAGW